MKRVKVNLPENRSYPILVGKDILFPASNWLKNGQKGILVYDTRLKEVACKLAGELKCMEYPFRASEKAKEMGSANKLYEKMVKGGLDRNSYLIALGGGVIGDVAGFVASTYLRGIKWVSIPTTLLAQVDSGIGGKTGVNLAIGKNLVGTFHQPSVVVSELNFLQTLSKRDLVSGLAEVIKYGLIFDPRLYSSLQKHWQSYLDLDPKLITQAVFRSSQLKAKVVEQDEFDRAGIRQALNFGHTLGHAFESVTGYGVFRHGEAIILGMRLALLLSVYRGHLHEEVQQSIDRFLKSIKLPKLPSIEVSSILNNIKYDKKKTGGKIGFVLLKEIGNTVIDYDVTSHQIKNALRVLE